MISVVGSAHPFSLCACDGSDHALVKIAKRAGNAGLDLVGDNTLIDS